MPNTAADPDATDCLRALTLTQPWASLVALGAKHIETRSWGTAYRGRLAIHAAKNFPASAQALCATEPFCRYTPDPAALPLGAVVALCRLVTVASTAGSHPSLREQAFGNFAPGRWAWYLGQVEALEPPIPCRGALGLWRWTRPHGPQP